MASRCLVCAAALLLAGHTVHAATATTCELDVNFFPAGTTNDPASLTKVGQAKLNNTASNKLSPVTLASTDSPVINLMPVHPLLTTNGECVPEACLPATTGAGRRLAAAECSISARGRLLTADSALCSIVLSPVAFTVSYSINGSVDSVVGTFVDGDAVAAPPQITPTEFARLPGGFTYCMAITIALVPRNATVTGYSGKLPAAADSLTKDVCFFKARAGSAEDTAAAMPDASTAPANTSAGGAPASPKYYCAKSLAVAGTRLANRTVGSGELGVADCATACSAQGSRCSAFAIAGTGCALLAAVNTSRSANSAEVYATCLKSRDDWLSLGTAATASDPTLSGYYCLPSYDVAGDAATGRGATNLLASTAGACASSCTANGGCGFFVLASDGCYLKSNAVNGQYGTTGPSSLVSVSCLTRDEWLNFGNGLDYLIPQDTTAAGSTTTTNATSAASYQCVTQWAVPGVALDNATVADGQAGAVACAAQCDRVPTNCRAFSVGNRTCTLFGAINATRGVADAAVQYTCLRSLADYTALGNPDANGMYCLGGYDVTGDGFGDTVPYTRAAGDTGAPAECKAACRSSPQCQFVVASAGQCYLKNNMLAGASGDTGPNPAVDSTCINGASNWAAFAQIISASSGPSSLSLTAGNTMASTYTSAAASAQLPNTVFFAVLCVALGIVML